MLQFLTCPPSLWPGPAGYGDYVTAFPAAALLAKMATLAAAEREMGAGSETGTEQQQRQMQHTTPDTDVYAQSGA